MYVCVFVWLCVHVCVWGVGEWVSSVLKMSRNLSSIKCESNTQLLKLNVICVKVRGSVLRSGIKSKNLKVQYTDR